MLYKMIEGVYIKMKDYYNKFFVYKRENVDNLGFYYYQDKNGDKFLIFGNYFGDGFFDNYGLVVRFNRDFMFWLFFVLDRNDVFG